MTARKASAFWSSGVISRNSVPRVGKSGMSRMYFLRSNCCPLGQATLVRRRQRPMRPWQ